MADLVIRDDKLAARLRAIADREQRSVEDVLVAMVASYRSEVQATDGFSSLAVAALEADIASEAEVDTSDHVKDILRQEYADHLAEKPSNDETRAD